jgi:hypothetical protein|tara:strand:+ start:191 stop:322 length:132 start_codon:yes stop_codon:yes gene_type:complete
VEEINTTVVNELGLIMALVDTACQIATAIGVVVIATRINSTKG